MEKQRTKSLPISKEMVEAAYQRVRSKKGGAGIDNQGWESFDFDLEKHLYKIWNRLASGSYYPPAVKSVSIPKKSGGHRILGIPTISDRIAQEVLRHYLEPRLEAEFSNDSYGYRPLRSAHDALEKVRKNVRNYEWVLDIDLAAFFDNVSHELLMKALDRHVEEKWVKMYIQRWLEAPVASSSEETTTPREKGVPQGGVISPLLSNLYLHYVLDLWLSKQYGELCFVRYADDIVIHCRSEKEAKEVLEAIKERLTDCELSINEKKTKLVHCQDYRRKKKHYPVRFDFLGFSFQPRPTESYGGGYFLGFDCAISKSSEQSILEKLKDLRIHRRSTFTLEQIARLLNPMVRGWINYYGRFRRRNLDRIINALNYRLMKWVKNRYKISSVKRANSPALRDCKLA